MHAILKSFLSKETISMHHYLNNSASIHLKTSIVKMHCQLHANVQILAEEYFIPHWQFKSSLCQKIIIKEKSNDLSSLRWHSSSSGTTSASHPPWIYRYFCQIP
mmetsp:Transcript_16493/g.34660  ORF Transcript_16493/g.34660 Transcript_16493/m.34660 type:complete len:104 (+) Transcript_16493:98-409(+)